MPYDAPIMPTYIVTIGVVTGLVSSDHFLLTTSGSYIRLRFYPTRELSWYAELKKWLKTVQLYKLVYFYWV